MLPFSGEPAPPSDPPEASPASVWTLSAALREIDRLREENRRLREGAVGCPHYRRGCARVDRMLFRVDL